MPTSEEEVVERGEGAVSEEDQAPETLNDEAAAPEPTAEERHAAELAKLKNQLLRTAADFDNYRKRARKDVEEAQKQTRGKTIVALLPLIDNLHRALAAAETAQDVESVTSGVRMVLRSFDEVAEQLNLERVKTSGELFDPAVHDAVQQVETDEHPVGTIVAEVMGGYKLGERLLRPAMVVVAKPPAPPSEDEPAEEED